MIDSKNRAIFEAYKLMMILYKFDLKSSPITETIANVNHLMWLQEMEYRYQENDFYGNFYDSAE